MMAERARSRHARLALEAERQTGFAVVVRGSCSGIGWSKQRDDRFIKRDRKESRATVCRNNEPRAAHARLCETDRQFFETSKTYYGGMGGAGDNFLGRSAIRRAAVHQHR
jgi:hypothetical protein